MGKSQRLRYRDLRAMYLLVGECREMGMSPDQWNRRLIEGACRMTGARGGVVIESQGPGEDLSPRIIRTADWGWDGSDRSHWLRYIQDGAFGRNPLMPGMYRRARPLAVTLREEILDDRGWYGSETYEHYLGPGHTDDGIGGLAFYRPGRSHAIGLHRGVDERPLQRRHKRMVQILYGEITALLGSSLASWLPEPPPGLPPRAMEVLRLLMTGESEKRIARKLCLSPHTVHDYVKRLHRHYNVHSRAELTSHVWMQRGR